MTRRRLPIDSPAPSLRRRGRGAGEPAAHPVPPHRGPDASSALSVTNAETDPVGSPLLLDCWQVAQLLGIGRTKTFELMLQKRLPTVHIGRCVRVPRAALIAWIEAETILLKSPA